MHFHHKRREVAMRWILGWYVFCLLTAIPSAARDIQNKHKPNPAAASPKTRLIRYVDLQLAQKPINITLRRPTMQEVIKAIMSHEKHCAWKLAHGFLSVTHAGAFTGGQNLLAKRLPDFSSPRVSLQQASQLLYMSLSLRLHPDIRGFA